MSNQATGSVTPAGIASSAGGLKSPDGRYEVLQETPLFQNDHIGRIIQRDVRDTTTGNVKNHVMWSRDIDCVVVVLIAEDDATNKKAIWVKKEFKHGVMNYVVTSAAGGIKAGETPRAAATRELWKEFGVTPFSIEQIGDPHKESPNKTTNSSQFIFLASGISATSATREEGEIQKFPLTKEGVVSLLNSMTVVLQKLAIYEALRMSGNMHLLV